MQTLLLTTGWQVVQSASATDDLATNILKEAEAAQGWLSATVPGSVHQDLIAAGRIPDPFFGTNENDVQWVGEADWLYRCMFDSPADWSTSDQIDLCFEGLDTFATVWLNGESILTSDNMFVPARVPVKHLLKPAGNTLLIRFESALQRGHALEAQYGKRAAWNGDPSRVYVRKAQYHYGWDWGPTLLTAGLWRPVRLELYTTRIVEVAAPAEVSADLKKATLPVTVTLSAAQSGATVAIELFDPKGKSVATIALPADGTTLNHTFTVAKPNLWQPRGQGDQARYRLVITLRNGQTITDTHELRIGFRRLRLVQDPLIDQPGTSFTFEINNVPLFCGGANWIPADSFTPRVTDDQYRDWLTLAADGNLTMLRVWGGGIYEADIFYDLCDELGLLVWQDFMFACGMYPAHAAFLASVRAEAEANLRRLRTHPSIVLWCGNNEDYQIAESLNAYDSAVKDDFLSSAFPAREIYEHLLPEVCAALDPTRPYWPGSPYGGQSVADQTIGDRHTWDIWHGKMADYRDYPKFSGRFISEFGMEAAPALSTLEAYIRPEDQAIDSSVLRHHNKASDGPERLAHYLETNTPLPKTLEDYVYLTQFIQSEAMAAGIDGWRRQWGGAGKYAVSGALIWQLNDCWPVISWALADHQRRVKPAYYRVRRALAPISLGIAPINGGLAIWAVNATAAPIEADLDLRTFGLDGTRRGHESRQVMLPPGRSKELVRYTSGLQRLGEVAVAARLIRAGEVIARAARWPEPPKSAIYADPELRVTFPDPGHLTISVQRPARAVYFALPDARWDDNMLDLFPGDDRTIAFTGQAADVIPVRWFSVPLLPPMSLTRTP